MSDEEILATIHGTVDGNATPARDGAITWDPGHALAKVEAIGSELHRTLISDRAPDHAPEDRRPHRINEVMEVKFTMVAFGPPRARVLAGSRNGFLGLRRELPEINAENRLEAQHVSDADLNSLLTPCGFQPYTGALEDVEEIVWRIEARGLMGVILRLRTRSTGESMRPNRCRTDIYGPKVLVRPLHLLRANVRELASEVMGDICSFFDAPVAPTRFVAPVDDLLTRSPGLKW